MTRQKKGEMMKNETQNETQFVVERIEVDAVSAIDLREELAKADKPVEAYQITRLNSDGFRDCVPAHMIWFPDAGRAGIEWGADASWTDAHDPQDAAERYFGVGGKEM